MKADYSILHKSVRVIPSGNDRIILVILLFIVSSFSANSQENNLKETWTDNTAFIMPTRKWESGIFQSSRLGLNEKIELRANALLMPVLPNIGIKFSIGSGKGIFLSSEHCISIPSIFLNVMSFKGTGGLISPQYSFPFIMTFSNSLIATKLIGSSSLLTADAGITLSFRGRRPDYQSSIDIPFIYQRMAHYYEGASIKAGIYFKGNIVKDLYYEEGAGIFLITRKSDNIFLENSGFVLWSSKGSFRLKGGYLLSWGKYPFGNHLQLWPAFDLIFGSRSKAKNHL